LRIIFPNEKAMKYFYLFFFLNLAPVLLMAQSVDRSVIASAGMTKTTNSGIQVEWTLGELAVAGDIDKVASEGFQQAEEMTQGTSGRELVYEEEEEEEEEAMAPFAINAHPNPCLDQLHVQFEGFNESSSVEVFVFDSQGRSYWNTEAMQDQILVDVSSFAVGNYILAARQDEHYETTQFLKMQ